MMRSLRLDGRFVVLLMLVATSASAQDLRLSGHVASTSATPLVGAQVLLEGIGIGGHTDGDGNFAFILSVSRVHGQTVRLTASLIGFEMGSVDVVLSGTTLEHDFVLEARPITIGLPVIYPPPFTMTTANFLHDRSDVAHAAGLKDLSTSHRSGQRELRIWIPGLGSLEILRMVERSGVVTGELTRYRTWIDKHMRDQQLPFELKFNTKKCAHVTTAGLIFTCRMSIPDNADWKQPWDELEAAGTWDLPSSETWEQPLLVDESVGSLVTVELWDGQVYRAWSYVSPHELSLGRIPDGEERAYTIWRVTRGIDLLSRQ